MRKALKQCEITTLKSKVFTPPVIKCMCVTQTICLIKADKFILFMK